VAPASQNPVLIVVSLLKSLLAYAATNPGAVC
jgi:hypothetical protein